MNFATEFWDGFPMLCEHTEKGLNNFKDVAAFFKKISEIETEYGKAIKKSVKEVTKKGRLSGKVIMENEIGTMRGCWDTVAQQVDNVAESHIAHAEETMHIYNNLTEFVKQKENERKNLVNEGVKLGKTYEAQRSQHDKVRANYLQKMKDQDASEASLNKEQNHPKSKEEKVKKAKIALEKATQAAQQADQEYHDSVKLVNEQQLEFFTDLLPHLMKQFEEFEASRIRSLQAMTRTFVQITGEMGPSYTQATDAMNAAAEEVNVSQDLLDFVTANKTDNVPPGEILYVPYKEEEGKSVIESYPDHRKSVMLSASLTGLRLGTGHSTSAGIVIKEDELPVEVKIERCVLKIQERRVEINAHKKTISGMQSLLDMYSNNPTEADKVNNEINDLNIKISGLEAANQQSIDLLLELGGEIPPEPISEDNSQGQVNSSAAYDQQAYDQQAYDQQAYDEQAYSEQPYVEEQPYVDPGAGEVEYQEGEVVVAQVQALYGYEPQDESEVAMNEGDVFTLIAPDDGSGWATVLRADGQTSGFVPANYIQQL